MEIDISPRNNSTKEEMERRYQRAFDDLYEEAIIYENDLKAENKEKIRLHKKSERANMDWRKEKEKSENLERLVCEKEKLLAEKQAELEALRVKIAEMGKSSSSNSQNGDNDENSSQKVVDFPNSPPNFSAAVEKNSNLYKNATDFFGAYKKAHERMFADFNQNFAEFLDRLSRDGEKEPVAPLADSRDGEKDDEIARLKSQNEQLKSRLEVREKDYIQEIEVMWQTFNSVLLQGSSLMDS